MKLLLDTHCWLWYLLSPEKLNQATRELLQEPDHHVYLSAASAWEIVIKHDLGKLKLPLKPAEYVPKRLAASRHSSLAITQDHVLEIASLPLHHRDPFDRVLVAQARIDGLKLMTADKVMKLYDVPLVWAGPTPPDQKAEASLPTPDTGADEQPSREPRPEVAEEAGDEPAEEAGDEPAEEPDPSQAPRTSEGT